MKKVLEFAHFLIKENLKNNDNSIDMTVGNGNDTLYLAAISNHVYGFDIQQIAIDNTNKRLNANNVNNVSLYLDSHTNVDKYNLTDIGAVIFNLGYLPTGDKNITTNYKTTLEALNKALQILKVNGICVLVIYPGHQPGLEESNAILEFSKSLNQKQYSVLKYDFINQINNPPYLIAIQKIKD